MKHVCGPAMWNRSTADWQVLLLEGPVLAKDMRRLNTNSD